jgi:hypothetical protein
MQQKETHLRAPFLRGWLHEAILFSDWHLCSFTERCRVSAWKSCFGIVVEQERLSTLSSSDSLLPHIRVLIVAGYLSCCV